MRITDFKGIRPRTSPRLIGDTSAQTAANVNLSSGEARPLAEPELVYTPQKTGPFLSIFKAVHDPAVTANNVWFTWAYDVDVCRSPLPGTAKWIYSGDGEPRITTLALAMTGSGDNYPADARSLGVPKPITAPSVTPSGGALADVTRYYAYTFYDDWDQESAFSPLSSAITGKPDGTWSVSRMDAAPISSSTCVIFYNTDSKVLPLTATTGTITGASNAAPIVITDVAHGLETGDKVYVTGVGGNTAANNTYGTPHWTITKLTADTFELNGSTGNGAYTAGGTWTKVQPHWCRAGDEVVINSVLLDVASAPDSWVYTVAGDYSAQTSWARKADWGTCTKRLYRTTGTTGQWQLVAEGITATTYSDTLTDAQIPGDEAVSATWELPPVDLKGVMTLPSGALCGFSGNEICFSEPFQPHAWPPEYRMRSDYTVVAVGLFTSGVVVGTSGTPLVILGHEPGQMTGQPATGAYPCMSKRSMVSLGDRVGYATAHGYATIGDSGVELLTKDWFTRDDWDNYDPATMVAETVRGRLYLKTYGLTAPLLIFDYLDGTGLTTSDVSASELFADTLSGKLYVSDSVNLDIREFDPNDGIYMSMDWMSKEFVLPEPINLGAARVNFYSRWSQAQYDALLAQYNADIAANAVLLTSGDVGGELNGEEFNLFAVNDSSLTSVVSPSLEAPGVTFMLYVDGELLYTKTVTTVNGFPLPSGYKSDTFAVRVQGQSLVKSIDLAQTLTGLKNA